MIAANFMKEISCMKHEGKICGFKSVGQRGMAMIDDLRKKDITN